MDPKIDTTALSSIGDVATKLTETMTNLGGVVSSLVEKFTGLGAKQSEANKAQADSNDIFAKTKNYLKENSEVSGVLATRVLGVGEAFSKLSDSANATQSLTSQLGQLYKAADFTEKSLKELGAAFGIKLGTLPAEIKELVNGVAAGADQFFNLKNSYIQVQAAQGGLGQVFSKSGAELLGLNDIVKAHGNTMINVAEITGNSTATVTANWSALNAAIPKSADQMITGFGGGADGLNGLTLAMQLAAGTGMTFATVTQNLSEVWRAYGKTELKDGLEYTAKIAEVNTNLQLPMETTQKFVKDNIAAFSGLSDKADDSLNVLNKMQKSFEATGLSAVKSAEMIGGLTSHLANLTLGEKALLSAQSGGPGGLQGAIQIEKLLRDGKTEEVLNKAQESLKKQFGGKIVTQSEAAQSEEAAATFTRQREMLKSGVFGVSAKDDNQATRILEAFSKGTSAEKELKDPGKGLGDALSSGATLQKDGNTTLSKMAHDTERIQLEAIQSNFNLVQMITGITQMSRPGVLSKNAEVVDGSRNKAIAANAETKKASDGGLTTQTNLSDATSTAKDTLGKIISNIWNSFPDISQIDKAKIKSIEVESKSSDPKIRKDAESQAQSLYAGSISDFDTRKKSGASSDTLKTLEDQKNVYKQLLDNIHAQNTGRGTTMGVATTTATTVQANAATHAASPRGVKKAEEKQGITIDGVVLHCSNCGSNFSHSGVAAGNTP